MKVDKAFIIPVIVILSLLVVFMIFYNRYVHETKYENLDEHTRIIASAMWIYESEGVKEYLNLACKANNYKYLAVRHKNGDLFVEIINSNLKPIDEFLNSINLITTEKISSKVIYRGLIIGEIKADWYNKSVYVYAYLIFIAFLLITILWFYLGFRKSKQKLEISVMERTLDLQKEISERKQTAEALKQSQSNYRILIENLPQKIFLKDTQSTYITCNENLARDLKVTPQEFVGKNDYDFFPKELAEKYRNDDSRIMRNKSIEEIEEKYLVDGKEHIVQTVKTAVLDEDGKVTGLLGIFWDITDQRYMENQLRQAQKMESIGTLAGGIAHDFNNILGIIMGNAELAMLDIQDDNPARASLDELITASRRAKDVVRQLLSFARKTQISRTPIQILPVVQESLILVRSSIPVNIEIRQNFSDYIDPIVSDPIQINQILINLCTNAYHAMPEGGVIEVSLRNFELETVLPDQYPELEPGKYVKLSVHDTGCGISDDYIDRVFDPYFTTKTVGKGTGMGLSVVHGIVNEHGGTLYVKSELEKGTVFEVFFPSYKGETTSETKTYQKVPQGAGAGNILFVDDEVSLVKAMHKMLEGMGYDVDSTTNPDQAIEMFSMQPDRFDLVITDMAMPQMTGDRFITEILKIRPDIKIILCTGFSERINEEAAKDLGAHDYLEKPVDRDTFALRIRKVLSA